MKRRRALLVTLALSAALVAAVVALRRPYACFLARHWRNRLETVPEERAGVLLEGIARLGAPGIPVLVEALGSERECVAGGARRVLAKEMSRWESLRARDYSPKLAVLAEALADHVDELNPAARANAADLAAQILSLWTLDPTVVDPAEVIARCEKVLRTPNPQRPLLAQRGPRDQPVDSGSSGEPLSGASAGMQAGEHEPGPLLPKPDPMRSDLPPSQGDPLATETSEAPELRSNPFRSPELAETHLVEPGRLDGDGASESAARPLRALSEPGNAARTPDGAPEPSGDVEVTVVPRLRPLESFSDGTGRSLDFPGGRFRSADQATLDTVELMRRLQAADSQTAAAARAELVRRGFTEVHLALARQLFDPDPEVRARLGRVLLGLPNVDAVPWLLQMCRDEDPEVRLAAIGLMATTDDEALLKAAEKSAREDPDPRVQQQAERIARKRRSAGY